MKRRAFLGALSGGLFASCEFRDGQALPPGDLLGPDMALGHALRAGGLPHPSEEKRIGIAIIGAGIGGLAAAWQLARQGVTDVHMFELETVAGGNARTGESAITPYPLGAHYLPLPSPEATDLRALLADLGVLKGDPQAATPAYDERYLVHAPQERLYHGGLWHEGLMPRHGTRRRDLEQMQRFEDMIARFKTMRGTDDRRVFAIPSLLAGKHGASDTLDSGNMQDWMRAQGFDAALLDWTVNYGCRDDYGALARDVSAWAGIHYFASRIGTARNADAHSVLTWPQGNGWLVAQMLSLQTARGLPPVHTAALCSRVETAPGHALIDIYHAAEKRSVRYRAGRVIWAAPAFTLARAWANPPAGFAAAVGAIHSSPWLVANLTLDAAPQDAGPAALAWDNVLYDSHALGYVVATHQKIQVRPGPTVLTYYLPLAHMAPAQARARLASAPWREWATPILDELSRPHPDLRARLQRLDLWRWPHGMPRPTPGFRTLPVRRMLARSDGPLLFAHSDLSGMPLFEEAHFAGVRAAKFVLGRA